MTIHYHFSLHDMTLMGTDAWRDETHGRGPDDCVGQVERAKLPWQEAGTEPMDEKKPLAVLKKDTQNDITVVLEKSELLD